VTLLGWRARHAVLEAGVRAAARVAPERDEGRFRAAWTPVAAALRLHMDQEERVLLPVFDDHAARAAPNQRPDVVRADHARIRDHLAAIEAPADDVAAVVARAEQLSLLLQVLDHHDRREAGGMLAVLDEIVPAAERAAWIAVFEADEATLPIADVPLGPAPPAWPADGSAADRLAAAAAQDGDVGAAVDALPSLGGRNGARVTAGVRSAVARAVGATDREARRDALLDVLDALRRWRAVAHSQIWIA
jgi:hypothetical protein